MEKVATILKRYGQLGETQKKTKHLNLVKFGDNVKYDIRPYNALGEYGKGLRFTLEELIDLKNILNTMDLNLEKHLGDTIELDRIRGQYKIISKTYYKSNVIYYVKSIADTDYHFVVDSNYKILSPGFQSDTFIKNHFKIEKEI